MPLVVFCGFPCSGKSGRADELEKYLCRTYPDRRIVRLDDSISGFTRDAIYGDLRVEKEVRSLLKAEVMKALNEKEVVMLDALNYIKGFRYELYCAAKTAKTTMAVVFCDVSPDQVHEWHASQSVELRYERSVLDGLLNRLEVPDERNRWDSPLFRLVPSDPTPCESVCAAIFERLAPKPNQSTQTLPTGSNTLLQQRHRAVDDVVRHLVRELSRALPGDEVAIPDSSERFAVHRRVSAAELQRAKRQFLVIAKTRPVDEELTCLTSAFVQYLNSALR